MMFIRFLRVLDLEDTIGLLDHHLDRIGQLHHLKYLSLRGCSNIFCLPNSFGNLRHLQTLDVRGTRVSELPTTITNLVKLQSLRAPDYFEKGGNLKREDTNFEDITRHMDCLICCVTCLYISIPQLLPGDMNRRDALNLLRFRSMRGSGANVPRGLGQLKALHILVGVNVCKRNATLKEFRELTELRKLGVVGMRGKNSMSFWSAIADHYHLRSLSVQMSCNSNVYGLDGGLGKSLSPPSWLESLKLSGKLVRVTDWIHQLQNLSKLVLEYSYLDQDDVIQALGVLPNLAVLRLKCDSFLGKQLNFQNLAFRCLVVLELYALDLKSVLFEEDAMPRLQLLQIDGCYKLNEISGLSVLASLKEITLGSYDPRGLKEQVLNQLGEDLKHVIVNTV